MILHGVHSQARWMNLDEAEAILEKQTTHYEIQSDGRAESESDLILHILNEKGRLQFGTLRYSYTPKNYRLTIQDPYTINSTQKYSIGENDIVDTPIQATEGGFDELRQVVASFPQVQIGSRLSYKIKMSIHKPIFENQFSEKFIFGQGYPHNHLNLSFHSKIPLYVQINDPESAIEFSKIEKPPDYSYSFKLTKPVFHEVVNETRSFVPSNAYTWIVVSSKENFKDMFAALAEKYEKALAEPLPTSLQEIVELARKIDDPIAKMNSVLSSIADQIRYMGDWRSVDGGFIPRSLQTIASTHFGDCKDMALLTTKILRLLNFDAHVSLVQRGTLPETMTDVPYNSFNHAIVTVLLKPKTLKSHERRLWLDPTNFQSYAQGVMEDISDRKSLIIKTPSPELQEILFTNAEDTVDKTEYKYHFLNESHRVDDVKLFETGFFAAQHTGLSIDYSKQQIEDEILAGNIDKGDIYSFQFSPWNLKSRIVAPVSLSWHVDHRYRRASTSTGPGFTLRAPSIVSDLNRVDLDSRKSDYSLGLPSITEGSGTISNFEIIGHHIRTCNIKSKWLDYSVKIDSSSNPVRLKDRLVIKSRWIHVDELQSPEFKNLIASARYCSSDQLLIYRVPKVIDKK